jgi:hypothetical protein
LDWECLGNLDIWNDEACLGVLNGANYLLGVLSKKVKDQENGVGLFITRRSILPQRAFGIKIE